MDISEASQEDMLAALVTADGELVRGMSTSRIIFPELFKRLDAVTAERDLLRALAEEEEDDEAEAGPGIPVASGSPGPGYYEPLDAQNTEMLHADMGIDLIKTVIEGSPEFTRFKVRGKLPPLYLGGGSGKAIGWKTRPMQNLEFIADSADAALGGVRLGISAGGIGDNFRLVGLPIYPQMDGDKAPILCVTNMNQGAHLVLIDCDLRAVPGGSSYYGKGFKWGIMTKGMKLTAKNLITDSSGEHSIYDKNSQGTHIDGLTNRVNEFGYGNIRTLYQHTERDPSKTDLKGGPKSQGDIILLNLHAKKCGHYHHAESGVGKGGSAITISGHSGDRVLIKDAIVENTFAGGIAAWAEYVHGEGFRGYGLPAIHRLEIENYSQNLVGSRNAVNISSVSELRMDGVDPELVKLDHQFKDGLEEVAQMSNIHWTDLG